MSYDDTPLNPTQRTLRKVVGRDGDTGVEVHAKLDRIKDDSTLILGDTTLLPTLLGGVADYDTGTLHGDLAVLNTLLDDANVDTAAIIAILEDGGFGVEAIQNAITAAKAVIDNTNANVGTPVSGTVATNIEGVKAETALIKADTTGILNVIGSPANTNLADDNREIVSKIDQIQNNTRTTISLLGEMEVPATGDDYFLVQLNNFDNTGNMEALNSLPTVTVKSFTGTDRTGNLVDDAGVADPTMILDSLGRYHIRYKVASTAVVNEGLLFTFTLAEGTPEVIRTLDRVSRVVEEISSTFTQTDRVNLGEVLTDTDSLQSTQVPAVQTTVDDIQGTANDIDALTIVMDGKLDDAAIELDKIESTSTGTFDRNTDSLEAISDAVEDLTTDVAGISAVSSVTQSFRASKASGAIASGGNEVVELNAASGVVSIASKIVTLKVIPRTTTSTDFTVEVYEAPTISDAYLFAKFTKARPGRGDLALRINQNFENREATPVPKIYVRITNEDDTTSTTFDVEVRADIISMV